MGIKKSLLCAAGVFMAAGGPVTLYTASDVANGVKHALNTDQTATTQQPAGKASEGIAQAGAPARAATGAAVGGPLVMPRMDEVFRFDLTVEWIMQRWPRVSTGLPYLQLQGYRVPLVTGTGLTDVAGSLTYYFNAYQRLDRIVFRGTTGDPTALVHLLSERNHFVRRLTNDPGLVVYEAVDSGNRPAGSLRIRSARVVKADQPYTRFELELVMDRAE